MLVIARDRGRAIVGEGKRLALADSEEVLRQQGRLHGHRHDRSGVAAENHLRGTARRCCIDERSAGSFVRDLISGNVDPVTEIDAEVDLHDRPSRCDGGGKRRRITGILDRIQQRLCVVREVIARLGRHHHRHLFGALQGIGALLVVGEVGQRSVVGEGERFAGGRLDERLRQHHRLQRSRTSG